ncbi:hypothetical protein BRADI_2g24715v3 [Brachypodium distachyon]|uniref:Uncharacterized protein n=1 Tax=Brachypodium distachyon TaxID=15368 RepID=I1HJ68_BRADI|nr:hypothetical protein BRADI_2g24715v3 [Brachypodium distachyon]
MKAALRALFDLPDDAKRRNTEVVIAGSGYVAPSAANLLYEPSASGTPPTSTPSAPASTRRPLELVQNCADLYGTEEYEGYRGEASR